MIKENQGLLNKIHVVLDAVVIVISYVLSWYLRFRSGIFEMDPWYLSLQVYMSVLIFIIPGYLLLYYIFQLYTPKRVRGRRLEAWNILQANTIGFLVFILVLYFRHQTDFSRTMIFVFYCINIFLEIVERNVIRMGLRKIRSQGFNQKHILLIGYSRAAEQYIDRILANPDWGYNIRGILADNVPRGTEYKKVRVLGRIDNLEIVLPENKLDEIVITLGLAEYHKLERIVKMCEKSGVHTKFIPDYNNVIPTKPYTEDLQGLPVINIRRVPLSDPLNKWMKRGVDIFGAIVAIILFSPVMIVTAIMIKKTSPGPLIFSQERVGLQNRPFKMYKFRSMVTNAEELKKKLAEETGQEDRFIFKMKDDPRITKVGHFIRKTSLDEFPQFYNVLKGDMSLVGPRPALPEEVARYGSLYSARLLVKPGITGPWQVSGRSDLSQEQSEYLDVSYIENWSIAGDLAILAKTVMVIFTGCGSY